ncbi:MAG: phytanoyl-CoA dioxygenase family protein [Planctomycetaceae bacterium]|nr:phytanoyl-CoA dioxygenase family protein [Planctomycetaceae bacterium]
MSATTGQILTDGWELLPSPYSPDQLQRLRDAAVKLADQQDDAVRQRDGAVYAARNVLSLCPEIVELWRTDSLVDWLSRLLGPKTGLVRALFFDKPPEQTWALPWHKDLLIAVRPFERVEGYSRPRLRAGVWHTEPPVEVLQQMITLRIHLDAMTLDNGPLQVLSGSHLTGKALQTSKHEPSTITSDAGDILAMRPLTVHSSGRSSPDCPSHRRVLHLEFSGMPSLPGRVEWAQFFPI